MTFIFSAEGALKAAKRECEKAERELLERKKELAAETAELGRIEGERKKITNKLNDNERGLSKYRGKLREWSHAVAEIESLKQEIIRLEKSIQKQEERVLLFKEKQRQMMEVVRERSRFVDALEERKAQERQEFERAEERKLEAERDDRSAIQWFRNKRARDGDN